MTAVAQLHVDDADHQLYMARAALEEGNFMRAYDLAMAAAADCQNAHEAAEAAKRGRS